MIPVATFKIDTIERQLCEMLFLKLFRTLLCVLTIFLPKHSGQRVLLIWKIPSQSATKPSTRWNVCSDSCYPRVSRATFFPLNVIHNAATRIPQETYTKIKDGLENECQRKKQKKEAKYYVLTVPGILLSHEWTNNQPRHFFLSQTKYIYSNSKVICLYPTTSVRHAIF